MVKDLQEAKHGVLIFQSLTFHRSHDVISMYIYPIFFIGSSFIYKHSECLCQVINKAGISLALEKDWSSTPFFRVFGMFLYATQLGTGTSYMCVMTTCKIQLFTLKHFTNKPHKTLQKKASQKTIHKKPLSNNNSYSVVKLVSPPSPPPRLIYPASGWVFFPTQKTFQK